MRKKIIYITLIIQFVTCILHPLWCAVGQGVSGAVHRYRDSLYQHISREGSARLSCHFTYARGSSIIYSDLGNNAAELSRLDSFIHYAAAHPEYSIKHIRLTGYCSIEGRYSDNENLARDRVNGFFRYLRDFHPALYRYPYDIAWVAEDWKTLSQLVRDSHLNERQEIIEIIRKVHTFDDREALLMKLNGGHAYREMEATLFPLLRRVEIEIEYTAQGSPAATRQLSPSEEKQQSEKKTVSSGAKPDPLIYNVLDKTTPQVTHQGTNTLKDGHQQDTHPQATPSPSERGGERLPRFCLKTNLLLWAGVQSDFTYTTPVANVALEYYITPHWSVEVGAAYSYWHYDNNREFQGISGYRVEPRYRMPFANRKVEAFAGLYGRFGDYDRRTRPQGNPPLL